MLYNGMSNYWDKIMISGRDEKCIKNFGRKSWKQETLGRLRHRCEGNIRMDVMK